MKVVNKTKPLTRFSDLDVGDCFIVCGNLYMKALADGVKFAVSLSSGKAACDICNQNEVVPVEAEVHITSGW